MTDEDREEIKIIFERLIKDFMSAQKPMPVPNATEILIRPTSLGAVSVSGYCCIPVFKGCIPHTLTLPLSSRTRELLDRISEKTGESKEEIIGKLELQISDRLISEEIKNLADKMGIE